MTDRRSFLVTLAGGAAAASLPLGAQSRKTSRPPSDVALLNIALELEHTAIYAYGLAGGSGLLSKGVLSVGGLFKASHETHREALTAVIQQAGGFPMAPRKSYDLSAFELKTEGDVLRLALFLEMKAARTYHKALSQFRNPKLLDAAARIMGDEVSHATVLRSALGKAPVGFYGQLDEEGF